MGAPYSSRFSLPPGLRYLHAPTAASRRGGLVSSVGYVSAVAQEGAYGQRGALIAAGIGGLVLCGLAFAVVLTSDQPGNRPLIALGRVLIIAVPIAVGIWLWSQPQYERFGRLLVAGRLHVVRRGAGGVEQLGAVQHRPHRRLDGRDGDALPDALVPERTAEDDSRAGAGLGDSGVPAVLFAPVALIVRELPRAGAAASCGMDCPANAFFVLASEPAFVEGWLRPVRQHWWRRIYVATVVLLVLRIRPPHI